MAYRHALYAATLADLMPSLATTVAAQEADANFRATLSPLNAEVVGSKTTGEATFTLSGNDLTIRVTVNGTPLNIAHLPHFDGFVEGERQSECPTAESDANGDGIIDLIETEPAAGITMVPVHDDLVSIGIVRDAYPTANVEGTYTYEQTVSLSALRDAFVAKFLDQQLDLVRRVVLVHTVPPSTKLPESVASLRDVPAQITLPIACGVITASDG